MQFYDNYKYKINIDKLYNDIISKNFNNVYEIENYKRTFLIKK